MEPCDREIQKIKSGSAYEQGDKSPSGLFKALHNLFFLPVMADDINLELKLPCLIGINSEEGAFLSAGLSGLRGRRLSRLNNSSLKKGLKQSGEDGRNGLLSSLLWLSRLPVASTEAAEAKVRAHYGLQDEVESWSQDRLTRAISDALFVYPFYRMLSTLSRHKTQPPRLEDARVFAYRYSHRGEASLTQIITNGTGGATEAVSHFDEVLIQFQNKVIIFIEVLTSDKFDCFEC